MSRFGKEAEQQLMGCVRDVQQYISDGASPDDAIVKIARERSVHPDMVPLIVQATNVGRQSYQREKAAGQGILDRIAEFPLARIENVKEALYPSKPEKPSAVLSKTAVSADYSRAPQPVMQYEKAAHTKLASTKLPASFFTQPEPGYQGDPKTKIARMQSAKMRITREVDEAKIAELQSRDRFLAGMGKVADYFKYANHSSLPMAEVEWNARQAMGPCSTDVFNYVRARNQVKQAEALQPPRLARMVNFNAAPYSDISNAIKLAEDYATARRLVSQLEDAAVEKTAQVMRPFSEHFPTPTMGVLGRPEQDFSLNKAASFLNSAIAGVSGSMASSLKPKSPGDMVTSLGAKLDDPAHNDDLRGIEAKAMLNDLLANDDIVAGFDPAEVTEAYNEITQLAPSAATQPAVMRPLLRKRLTAGSVEPFEAQQIADIEKTVRQTDNIGRQGGQNVSPVLA